METDKPIPISSTRENTTPSNAAAAWWFIGFATAIPVNVLLWQLVFR
jgi:hypothetical protein